MKFYSGKDSVSGINDFTTSERILSVLTTHEIKYFRKKRPDWKFEITSGVVSESSIKGCDLFRCL
jgi:hypothetical protein